MNLVVLHLLALTLVVFCKANTCKWTECQKDWNIRGCEPNMTQVNTRFCQDGQEYYCCPSTTDPIQQDKVEMECWWSSCQPSNLTQRGCPGNTILSSSEPCEDGNVFKCCSPEKEEVISGDSYVDFVKYSLLKGRNFSITPDNLPCLAVDPNKQSLLKIKNEGIYMCDLCPYFPHRRLVNAYLSNYPTDIVPNVLFPECFNLCFNRNDCVAYSYDHLEHSCHTFNNTMGNFIEGKKWTTVIMTQPVGVVEKWTYSRHTSITGVILQSTKVNNFLLCLAKCDAINECNYVSYYITTSNCSMFSSQDTIKYVDLHYAHISGFKISSMPVGGNAISRFVEEGDDLFETGITKNAPNNQECSSLRNSTHSAFYSQSCFASNSSECDVSTGCKMCYYPEKTNEHNNVAICPDSKWITVSELKQTIQKASGSCLADPSCVGVGYNSNTNEVHRLTLNNFISDNYTTKFILKYPIKPSGDQILMTKYDFLFNYDIERFSNNSRFQEITGTLKQCLVLFGSNNNFTRMSYWNNKCKISSEEVKYVLKSENYVTVFKKPGLLTPLLNYARTPGFVIPKDFAKHMHQCGGDCEEICSRKCNQEFKSWCSHFSIEQNVSSSICYFFKVLSGSVKDINLQQIENGQLFTKLSSASFTLESFNKLNFFQASDIYDCFHPESVVQQSQTSLTSLETIDSEDIVGLRRKRYGIVFQHDEAVAMFGQIKETVEETVQDAVDNVVDTAKGLAGSIEHTVNGDLDKAEEAFLTIPIVKDVKNVVELNEAVFTGDWEKAEEKGIEFLQSSMMDMATSAIPVVGKGVGRGLKVVGKTLKKQVSRVKQTAKKNIDTLTDRNKKIDTKKNDRDSNDNDNNKERENNNDNEHNNKGRNNDDKSNENDKDLERKHCKQRTKRATNTRKRQNPEDCEDEEENNLCPRINIIPEAISMTKCKNRRPNAECEFVCNPGYNEPNENVKCVQVGNKKPHWSEEPECKKISCGHSDHPLIPLTSPHVTAFGNVEFGKFVTAYVVLFDKQRKIPVWSINLHQSDQFLSRDYTAFKQFRRENTFEKFPCTELQNHQASDIDYAFSGWDRGHLTPANVERWSEKAILSSNLYINVAPQEPYTNRHPWAILEKRVEQFTKERRSLVVTGLCSSSLGKLNNKVDIPSCFYKMICYRDSNNDHQVVGFIADNKPVSTQQEKKARKRQVYTPVSQTEIKLLKLLVISKNMKANTPWSSSAVYMNQGRPIRVGLDSAVWMPINPFVCEGKLHLPDKERQLWQDFLPTVDDNDRRKRTVDEQLEEYTNNTEIKNNLSDNNKMNDGISVLEEESVLVNVQNCNKRIISYYTSSGDKEIVGSELTRLTHVIYAFIPMRADGSIEMNIQNVTDTNKLYKARQRLDNLMKTASAYPHVKVMFAVGGRENSQYFSSVAASPKKRITFIATIIKCIQRYGFNGVEINWQYPVTGGADEGIPRDKQNYVILLKEIRTALDSLAETQRQARYLLSFAGATEKWTIDRGFDLPGLLKYADFVNIMTHDYFGPFSSMSSYTGTASPTYLGFSEKVKMDWTVEYYTCVTKLPHKINMGVAFYGRYWENVGPPVYEKNGMWRTSTNGTFQRGNVPYYKIQSEYLSNGFQQSFHEESKTPYAWNAATRTFLEYEDKKSLQFKVDYANNKNLGGIMIWGVEMDDNELTLLDTVASVSLCNKTNHNEINHLCSSMDEKKLWSFENQYTEY